MMNETTISVLIIGALLCYTGIKLIEVIQKTNKNFKEVDERLIELEEKFRKSSKSF